MTLKQFRSLLHNSRAPYVVKLASGEQMKVPHIDFFALPGPSAGEDENETVIGVYFAGGLELIDLGHVVSVHTRLKKPV